MNPWGYNSTPVPAALLFSNSFLMTILAHSLCFPSFGTQHPVLKGSLPKPHDVEKCHSLTEAIVGEKWWCIVPLIILIRVLAILVLKCPSVPLLLETSCRPLFFAATSCHIFLPFPTSCLSPLVPNLSTSCLYILRQFGCQIDPRSCPQSLPQWLYQERLSPV